MTVNPSPPNSPGVTADLPMARALRTGSALLGRLGRDTAYLLTGLPVAIASFTVLVAGLCLGVSLLITVLGIPVAVGMLASAIGFERLERLRLRAQGTDLAPVHYAPPEGTGLRRMLNRLRDQQQWAAVLHGIGAFPLAIVTWSIAVAWWAGTLGGLTYWWWERWLPSVATDGTTGLAKLLDLPMGESQANLIVGIVFAATLVPVLRGCTMLHVGWARLLLTGASRRTLAAQVSDLNARRAAASSAETQSLRRLERDIHDGPQQRLVRLGMDLSVAERRLDHDPATALELIAAARLQATETLAELRALSRGIAPPVLADRGLEAALTAVAARSTIPTTVSIELPTPARPASEVENGAYFVACESLANTAKHASATRAAVRVRHVPETDDSPARLVVEIEDDGIGGAAPIPSHGLVGLTDRVEGLGGEFTVSSPTGGPTLVTATLPWV